MSRIWNRSGFRYTVLGLLLLGLFLWGLHYAFVRSGQVRWQRIEAKFKADGESLDFFSLYPPPIPDEENFCAIEPLRGIRIPDGTSPEAIEAQKKREAIAAALKSLQTPSRAGEKNPPLASWTQFPDPFQGATDNADEALAAIHKAGTLLPANGEPSWAAVKLALEQHAPIIRQLSEAAEKRQKAAFLPRLTRETMPKMLVSIPVPEQNSAQNLANLLRFHSLVCLRSENDKAALGSLRAMLCLAQASDAVGTIIGHLVATTIRAQAQQVTHVLVSRRRLGEPDLILLQQEWQRQDLLSAHLRVMRTEITISMDSIHHLESDPAALPALLSTTSASSGKVTAPPQRFSMLVRILLQHSKAVTLEFGHENFISQLKNHGFHGYHAAMNRARNELSSLRGWANIEWLVPQLLQTSYFLIGEMTSYQEDQRLRALLACALERHFIRHGSYPSTLGALDSNLRSGISLQDVNGEPMHYSPLPGGRYRLWSPGPDGKDDGGKFSSEIATRGFKSSTPYNPRYLGDWVWRYDPAPKAP